MAIFKYIIRDPIDGTDVLGSPVAWKFWEKDRTRTGKKGRFSDPCTYWSFLLNKTVPKTTHFCQKPQNFNSQCSKSVLCIHFWIKLILDFALLQKYRNKNNWTARIRCIGFYFEKNQMQMKKADESKWDYSYWIQIMFGDINTKMINIWNQTIEFEMCIITKIFEPIIFTHFYRISTGKHSIRMNQKWPCS